LHFQNGETPLHFAARQGYLDTVKLLLEDKANPALQNNLGENSVHIAVKDCHYPITENIIQYTINTSSKEDAKKLVNMQNKVMLITVKPLYLQHAVKPIIKKRIKNKPKLCIGLFIPY